MSGGASIALTVLFAFVPTPLQKTLIGIAAVACGVGASYKVWRDERLRYITERDRNEIPRFGGEIRNIQLEASKDGTGVYVEAAVIAVNQSFGAVAIKSLSVMVTDTDGRVFTQANPYVFRKLTKPPFTERFAFPTNLLIHGDPIALCVHAHFEAITKDRLDALSVKVRLTDMLTKEDHILQCQL